MNLFRIQENTEKNKYSLDTLKLILSVMVVFIHSRIFLDSSLILDAFTSNGFFRVAVPIFLSSMVIIFQVIKISLKNGFLVHCIYI